MIFLIVGPSGSGKDTLIDYAVNKLPVKKAKRVITRENNQYEDFKSVSDDEFNQQQFFIKWESYGRKYGIPPLSDDHYLLNVSRQVINQVKALKPDTKVIELTTKPEVLAKRVNKRDRDTIKEKKERLKRAVNINSDFKIDTSSSDVSVAGEELINYLKKFI